ncbi:uncharacterized protein LOC127834396 isoform X1 [Dreissena polymorpha]|uniref:Uncharacterized protein n=2 Tax=Dreissena polymorpha TaxID=45954 RepID=A0A9D4G4H3_DREPO|nr:uncharacterized protein LOC127834396 isoform X1 [Dreissena polymorpha]KAH3807392.1 hypothetical protein DPMN_135732 [Dreissena polymorpha]
MLVMARYAIFVLAVCVSLCQVAWCGCMDDLQKDQMFMDCMIGYQTFVQQAAQTGGNIATMMCSTEGQAAMGCLIDFGSRCPDLLQGQGLDPEQITAMCSQAAGTGGFSKTCMDAQNCLALSMSMGGSELPTPKTKFGYVPELMKQICGSFSEVFNCVTPQVENECSLVVDGVRNISAMVQMGMPPGLMFPKYETLRMLAKERCPTLPKDFGTSRCVYDTLQNQTFEDCLNTVNINYTTPEKKVSCGAVDARLACVNDALVAKCGKEHYNGIVNHAEYFFTDEPLTCDRTSSAAYAYLSMMTSLFAVLFVLILS